MVRVNLHRRALTLCVLLPAAQGILLAGVWLGAPKNLLLLGGGGALLIELAAAWLWFLRPYSRLGRMEERACQERSLPAAMEIIYSRQDERLKRKLFSSVNYQEQLRLEVKQSELLALQNQINPHFLYNTLEAIRSDALIYGVDPIAEITQQMAGFFRYAISSMDHLVTLDEELHSVEVYMNIQRYRFGPELELTIQSHLSSEEKPFYVPKMTLQPIVENAIFHGLEMREHLGTVTITLDRSEKELFISIRDSGVGMDKDTVAKLNASFRGETVTVRKGIALHNVNDRISLLFGEEYGLQVFSLVGIGTEVRVNLPAYFEGQHDVE